MALSKDTLLLYRGVELKLGYWGTTHFRSEFEIYILADVDISPNPNPFDFSTSESEYIKKTGIRIHFYQN